MPLKIYYRQKWYAPTTEAEIMDRWKQYFEERLDNNEEQPTETSDEADQRELKMEGREQERKKEVSRHYGRRT